jgi:protein-tyrosine phosphatase
MNRVRRIEGVTDLHHHLLPGVDDGAPDIATAVAMARTALAEGITTVVATPHTFDGVYDVDRTRAAAALGELAAALAAADVPLQLRLAGEVHLHEGIPALLAADPGVSLDGANRYLLLELPHQGPPPSLPDFLFRLAAGGTTALVAHPERNLAVRKQPELAVEWVRRGSLLQLTAGSLAGAFGEPIRACAESLLRAGVVHVVATDAHSPGKRPPLVQDAFAAAAAIVGDAGAERLFATNPTAVLAGAERDAIVPAEPVRRRGLFSVWR